MAPWTRVQVSPYWMSEVGPSVPWSHASLIGSPPPCCLGARTLEFSSELPCTSPLCSQFLHPSCLVRKAFLYGHTRRDARRPPPFTWLTEACWRRPGFPCLLTVEFKLITSKGFRCRAASKPAHHASICICSATSCNVAVSRSAVTCLRDTNTLM